MDETNEGPMAADPTEAPDTPDETPRAPSEEETTLPPFHKRLVDVFFNPGRLGAALKERPVWGVAMVLGAVLVVAMMMLIPAEMWAELQRQTLLKSGRQMPEMSEKAKLIISVMRPASGFLSMVIGEFIYAGVVTLIFAFVMGDEGRYRQYLSVVAHAWLVIAVVELLMVPLKIAQSNPQLTMSVGTFFFFLKTGYLAKVLNMLALSKLWAALVVASGVHAIDPKRKFSTAATVLIVLSVATTMIFAIFTPTPS